MLNSLPDGSVESIIPSNLDHAREIQDLIEKQLQTHQFEEKEIFGIRLALEEAIVNAMKHGNRMDAGKNVRVLFRVSSERFEIGITDEGPGYDPDSLPDPLSEENLERPCGRGLFLMKHYMTEVTVHPPGNRLTMSKVRQINGEAKH